MFAATPMASAEALRASFLASRDGRRAQGADTSTQDAEIAIRDQVGHVAGWVGGARVDITRCEWYPDETAAAQAAKYHAAEEGRGGVALQPGSVPWPAAARRCTTPGAPMTGGAPTPPTQPELAPAQSGARPWWPLAIGAGVVGLVAVLAWTRSR